MLLKNYYKPSEEEKEAAFREIYHFIQKFSMLEKFMVWAICWAMGDRLYIMVAQKMHSATMRTLQDAAVGMHAEFFKRKRKERAAIRRDGKGFVRATIVE